MVARDEVTDAGIGVGYAWAEEPRWHATVLVTGSSVGPVAAAAEELAAELWRVRQEFDFVAPTGTLDEAVDAALAQVAGGAGGLSGAAGGLSGAAGRAGPYLGSGSGDHPRAGGSGDVTGRLARLAESS